MDIEYYRNFIAIVEAGSISAAAKQIAIAQPALSNQLKVLQKRFGTQLLHVRRGAVTALSLRMQAVFYITRLSISARQKTAL